MMYLVSGVHLRKSMMGDVLSIVHRMSSIEATSAAEAVGKYVTWAMKETPEHALFRAPLVMRLESASAIVVTQEGEGA